MMKKGRIKQIVSFVLCIGILMNCGACAAQEGGEERVTSTPSAEVKIESTVAPEPTAEPTIEPTVTPTSTSTPEPTTEPTVTPTSTSTPEPTTEPTVTPTPTPTPEPTTEPTVTLTPTPEPTKAPTVTPTSTPIPTKAPTVTPVPTKEPTAPPKADSTDDSSDVMECRYTYSEQFAVKKEGRLSESSYFKNESEIYYHILENISGRASRYYMTFGAASSESVNAAAKQIAKLPGMRTIAVEKKEYWANGVAFSVEVEHVPEFATLLAWKSGDTSQLSRDGLKLLNKAKDVVAMSKEYGTTYEKVKFFHDYLVLNTVYDMSESDTVGQTAYGALIEGRCVCMGYTNAFHLLLTMAGIDCLIVSGQAGGGSHAWNKVRIDDAWYNVDVTWDDPVPDVAGSVGYAYLNVTDTQLAKDHVWDNTDLPIASATEYNYLQRTMPLFTGGDEMIRYCKECLAEGATGAEFIAAGETPDMQVLVQELQCGITYRTTDCQGGVWYQITFK